MTDSPPPGGLSTAGAPALEHAHDHEHTRTDRSRADSVFSALEQRAPPGVGVKDLRPLRGRPFGPIPDPDASLRRAHKQAENPRKKIHNKNYRVDRPRSFRNDGSSSRCVHARQAGPGTVISAAVITVRPHSVV